MGRYVFSAEDEAARLAIQAEVWEPAAERMLDRIGVPEGASCVDLGCGPMGILAPLAKRVGPEGRVIGVDLLASQLEAARAFVRRRGLACVSLVEADAYDTRLARGTFDLVHARFLLAPLGRPKDLIREMIALAKPGGVIVLEEPDQGSWEYLPVSPVWARVKAVFEAVFPRFGGDANAGRTTPGLLRDAGLEGLCVDAAVTSLKGAHPYMLTPVHGLLAMRRFIVAAGLMSPREVDEAEVEMARLAMDPSTHCTTFTLTQAWGRKPRHA